MLDPPPAPPLGNDLIVGGGAAAVRISSAQPHYEANPDVRVISAHHSYWTHLEAEYKLVSDVSAQQCLKALETFGPPGYSLGAVHGSISFERYRCLQAGNRRFYAAILGKRGWRRSMAIKYKVAVDHLYPRGFHLRLVTIRPYSPAALSRAAREVVGSGGGIRTRALRAYYNSKWRRVAVHRTLGLLYCISFGEARTLARTPHVRRQFEIEYWSRVIPRTMPADFGSHTLYVDHFVKLTTALRRHLKHLGVAAAPSAVTRTQWLETLS